MSRPWPGTLSAGDLTLRPLRRRDQRAWHRVRQDNAEWLRPWEATIPQPDPAIPTTFAAMVRHQRAEARAARSMSFAMIWQGHLVGQITLGGIAWGSLRSGYIGYWIAQEVAGQGITPTAVALLSDHAFGAVGLHRIEINIRPENRASLRVVAKLGFRREGYRPGYLHIDGAWRDHVSFAMLAEDCPPGGLLRAYRRARSAGRDSIEA